MTFKHLINRIVLFFTANIGLKIGSLVLALILWITITGQGNADRIIRDIPIQIRDIPEGMELVDKGIGSVQARIRGPKSLVPTLNIADFSVALKLPEGAGPGMVNLPVTRSNLSTPYSNQLTIMQISPAVVSVKIENIIQKSVRVQPFLRGAPDPNYELGQWRVSPPFAIISGPTSVVEKTDVVYTEPIDIVDQTLSFDDRVSIKPQDSLIKVKEPRQVTARVEIRERITERSFPEFELTVIPEPDLDLQLTPSLVTLTIKGPATILNRLKPSEIQLVLDWSNLEPGSHEVRPVLVTGETGIISIIIDPEIIALTVPDPTPTPSPTITPTATPSPAVD